MAIKAVIFDIGGVLCREESKKHYQKLARTFKFNLEKFKKAREKYIWQALKRKKKDFWYEIKLAEEMKINPPKFIKKWQAIRSKQIILKKSSKKMLVNLSKNYFLGTLTNVSHGHDVLREKRKIYKYFKINLKSCDLAMIKPSIKMFGLLLKKLKKEKIISKEVVFIDDFKENLIPAKKLGMHTILFKNNNQLVHDLKNLGVKI
ncbi:HAD-IA family hydrolase [Candidatus Pacearchaeota archaeon]|nr:HAD-IA family hydrolase [Candidatus Pacearchaeota archaeon]